jgi:hypothetical protein
LSKAGAVAALTFLALVSVGALILSLVALLKPEKVIHVIVPQPTVTVTGGSNEFTVSGNLTVGGHWFVSKTFTALPQWQVDQTLSCDSLQVADSSNLTYQSVTLNSAFLRNISTIGAFIEIGSASVSFTTPQTATSAYTVPGTTLWTVSNPMTLIGASDDNLYDVQTNSTQQTLSFISLPVTTGSVWVVAVQCSVISPSGYSSSDITISVNVVSYGASMQAFTQNQFQTNLSTAFLANQNQSLSGNNIINISSIVPVPTAAVGSGTPCFRPMVEFSIFNPPLNTVFEISNLTLYAYQIL